MDKLKIAHIGTGRRGAGTYLPLISKLTDDLELVAVCDPREESVTEQGEKYSVPAYTNTEQMLETVKPDICAIVITPATITSQDSFVPSVELVIAPKRLLTPISDGQTR